jgi:protein-S-isoprenylcysteine O-methyltransferase Ste14
MPEESKLEWSRIARRIRVPLGFLFAILYFWLARPTWQFIALGLILIIPGLLLRALASGHVRKNEALATTGPYAYTRNPLYLGSLLIGIGFAVASRSWWVGVGLILIFVVVYLPVIQSEEAFLRATFPEFADYARQVPRMFPRTAPFRVSVNESAANEPANGFSVGLYLKHREYNALLGTLALLAALALKLIL